LTAEVASLIAGNLHELPHPQHEGGIRLMGFRPFMLSQHPPEVREKVNAHAQAIGEGVVELLKRNGKSVVDTTELNHLRTVAETQASTGPKVARVHCAHCATEVMRLTVDDTMHAKLHRVAMESFGIPHRCWE
jgi:hypothetical protein